MQPNPNITLAILAGGKASRMGGKDKALLEIDGESFISRIHRNLSPLFCRTIIIANDSIDYKIENVEVYPDIIPNVGPLGGIHTALVNLKTPYVFVVSCDMPFVSSEIANEIASCFLSEEIDILVPKIESYHEPLFAIYSKHLANKIEAILAKTDGKPIKDLFSLAKTSYISFPNNPLNKRCFTNINSINDLENLKG